MLRHFLQTCYKIQARKEKYLTSKMELNLVKYLRQKKRDDKRLKTTLWATKGPTDQRTDWPTDWKVVYKLEIKLITKWMREGNQFPRVNSTWNECCIIIWNFSPHPLFFQMLFVVEFQVCLIMFRWIIKTSLFTKSSNSNVKRRIKKELQGLYCRSR